MFFASDNWAGVAPEINQALQDHNVGKMPAYGTSYLDVSIENRMKEIFECDLSVFFVSTGTAANAIAIASAAKPGGVGLCHTQAHVTEDECGAPELYSGGRLASVGGELGKMNPLALERALAKFEPGFVHHGRPSIVSLTQSTEIGTLYSLDEIDEISRLAKSRDVPLHMDGARFTNALVSLDVSAAEMTWKRGVDLLSFGGTKNGCWCAEALISFDKAKDEELHFLRKRAGQLFSKSRFVAAQFEAYLNDDLWLKLAAHANGMTERLAAGIRSSKTARLAWEPQANEIFIVMKKTMAEELRSKGAAFYEWPMPSAYLNLVNGDEDLYRLVTSFATTQDEVNQFTACLSA